jgi:hypothetical protein
LIENYEVGDQDELAMEYPGMAESISSSIRRKNNAGSRIEEIGKHFDVGWRPKEGNLCSYKDGFSLHANVSIKGFDRSGLEHLCRYIARPAISNNRLSIDEENGKIIFELKKPYSNGTTHLKFTPKEFIKKLVALVPPPRINLTRYHGVLGPRSKLRSKVVNNKKKDNKKKDNKKKDNTKKRYRTPWAKLLKRVFGFEVDKCKCGGTLKIISAILDVDIAIGIMNSLNLEIFLPIPTPARGPPTSLFDF